MKRKFRRCPRCGRGRRKQEFSILPHLRNPETKAYAVHPFCHECQRSLAPRNHYADRNAALRGLGFLSYAEYLASPLWAKIRARVMAAKGYRCELCGGRATQIHHNIYRAKELLGQSLKGMKALCADCHKSIEFSGGRKTNLIEAGHTFYKTKASAKAVVADAQLIKSAAA